ncbi:hypothetical protein Bca101_081447 [Brassica carinata]
MGVVRVYTVCDDSRYMVVRNVPALGCSYDLMSLFTTYGYGEVEECKPLDAEDCEEFTDVFWLKFRLISNARFAKRKLDESVFLGNRLQISYAPEFESHSDTKDKLETRRKDVLSRTNSQKAKNASQVTKSDSFFPQRSLEREKEYQFHRRNAPITQFHLTREKLDKIH